MELEKEILKINGPILILGGSGFIGSNLFRLILKYRNDVFATTRSLQAWRLDGLSHENIIEVNLNIDKELERLINDIKPKTIYNFAAYGAYPFEEDSNQVYQTNFILTAKILKLLENSGIAFYLHAGSSSEYGNNCAAPLEDSQTLPNSHYAVSKVACSELIKYYGKIKKLPCANLRLYSVYGAFEEPSRLIPNLIKHGLNKEYPEFVNPNISRDFIYIEDVCEAFILATINLKKEYYGEAFNIGTGNITTIGEIASLANELFNIDYDPTFKMKERRWDNCNWYSNPQKAKNCFGWSAKTQLRKGLLDTIKWYVEFSSKYEYFQYSKNGLFQKDYSISAIVACYKDAQALPIMYERLTKTFKNLKIDYEIIFVNDNSPDNSEEIICRLSKNDSKVIGISHSRNFGSQAAFKSGMELSSKSACVLLDGDLQDPPEIIELFVAKWKEGYDIVYGRRVKREAPLLMQFFYKMFYRVFDTFSYLSIPHDAGDFSLMNRKVVKRILQFTERDLFLRGIRAFVGFKQIGVDYIRPERMFGVSTNNFFKNIGWAKKGIFSFSNTPLNILSFAGIILFLSSMLLSFAQILGRILFPELVPKGLTSIILLIMIFGSLNILAIAIVGEYISKIFEEVKQRPHFIRRSIIRDGEIKSIEND